MLITFNVLMTPTQSKSSNLLYIKVIMDKYLKALSVILNFNFLIGKFIYNSVILICHE